MKKAELYGYFFSKKFQYIVQNIKNYYNYDADEKDKKNVSQHCKYKTFSEFLTCAKLGVVSGSGTGSASNRCRSATLLCTLDTGSLPNPTTDLINWEDQVGLLASLADGCLFN